MIAVKSPLPGLETSGFSWKLVRNARRTSACADADSPTRTLATATPMMSRFMPADLRARNDGSLHRGTPTQRDDLLVDDDREDDRPRRPMNVRARPRVPEFSAVRQ